MAKRKLTSFSADEADDVFTPSVKTVKGGALAENSQPPKAAPKRTQQPVKKAAKAKAAAAVSTEKKGTVKTEKKKKTAPVQSTKQTAPVRSENSPSTPAPVREAAMNEAIAANAGASALKRNEAGDSGEELIQLVGFCLGDEEFGVDINEVHEINRSIEITPVPRTPDFVEGVINLRGKVIPVINMRIRFQLPGIEKNNQTRIVIVEVDSKIVGMLVDSVTEVLRISSNTIEPPPDILSGIDTDNIRGVAKLENRLLILLDLSRVLSNVDTRKGDAV